MRIKYLFYILFVFLTISSIKSTAQDRVSLYSDEQIIAKWKEAQAAGISEQDMYKLLAQKGASAAEIRSLQERIAILGLSKKAAPKPSTPANNKKASAPATVNAVETAPKRDTTPPKPIAAKPALSVYGTDIFNQSIKTFESGITMSTPKGYVLGPGDNVVVLLTGLNETSLNEKISPDGNLQIPRAGIVYLNGFTIEQATSIIKNKMAQVYPALRSGQTRLTVNLGSSRSIRIIITGEAKTPGSYTLSSLSTIFNALYNSGGPNANGSLRYIRLIRNNKLYKTVDFYSFLQNGLMDATRLEDQDVIQIPVYKKRVSITGEVKRPAIYELKDDEKLDDLINYAGGYTDIAYRGLATIDQINALQREVKSVPSNLFANYTPNNGDLVEIGAVTNRYTNRIVLEGSVYRPGIYELTAGFTLSQLLKSAQGLKPEAYTESGYIKRTSPNLEKTFITFKPIDVINGRNDIALLREDSVMIMDQNVFVSTQKVTVQGYVRRPTDITYRKGLKLADAIAIAGGFADEAADHHIEVNRIIKNESDSVANQLVSTIRVNMDDKADANRDIELQPMDIINVPRLVNYHGLGNVSVTGEVAFPGDFPVQKRDETALDFLQRAGGVTPYGSFENTQVYRNGVRVNLDFKNAKDNSISKKMILLPGDSVYVPRVISYVEVQGAVNNPQYITYNGRNFKYYINAAAGVTENARLKGAYIKYPDGLNRPVRHFLFFRNYPPVKPGSTIVVPEKSADAFKFGLSDLGIIAPALTALVSIIAILSK